MTSDESPPPPERDSKARAKLRAGQRRADALRENLKRRKALLRARAAAAAKAGGSDEPEGD